MKERISDNYNNIRGLSQALARFGLGSRSRRERITEGDLIDVKDDSITNAERLEPGRASTPTEAGKIDLATHRPFDDDPHVN